MSCEKAIALVEKLVDGEASAVEKRDAESHLESCTSCQAHFEFLTSVAEAAGSNALPQPPDSYWEHLPRKILRRIEDDRARSRTSTRWRRLLAPDALRWGALGATLVVLVAVGASVFRDDPGLVFEEAPPAIAPAPAPQAAPAPRGLPSEEPAAPRQRNTATRAAEDVVAPSPSPPMARDEGAKTPASPGLESEAEDRIAGDAEAPWRALGYVAERPAESVAPASPTSGGALGVESTADRDRSLSASTEAEENAFRLLKQGEPAPEGRRARAEDAMVSLRARAEVAEVDCEGWRRFLSTYGDLGPRGTDARYELARCSLLRFESNPKTELRDEAVADAEAFLAREAEGARAEEIRKALGRAQRSP